MQRDNKYMERGHKINRGLKEGWRDSKQKTKYGNIKKEKRPPQTDTISFPVYSIHPCISY